jgi:hypothetical protein
MKAALTVIVAIAASSVLLQKLASAQAQIFPTSAGPVKITPLNHASTLIEAGGKTASTTADPANP